MYVEIADVNMVEISKIEPVVATESLKVDAEMATEGHNCSMYVEIADMNWKYLRSNL